MRANADYWPTWYRVTMVVLCALIGIVAAARGASVLAVISFAGAVLGLVALWYLRRRRSADNH